MTLLRFPSGSSKHDFLLVVFLVLGCAGCARRNSWCSSAWRVCGAVWPLLAAFLGKISASVTHLSAETARVRSATRFQSTSPEMSLRICLFKQCVLELLTGDRCCSGENRSDECVAHLPRMDNNVGCRYVLETYGGRGGARRLSQWSGNIRTTWNE